MTRVYKFADIGSDHYLVCTKSKPRLRKASKENVACRVKYNTAIIGIRPQKKEEPEVEEEGEVK